MADRGTSVGVVGAGAIGGALIDRLLAAGFTQDVVACEAREERRQEIAARYGVTVAAGPSAAARASIIVIAVPPAAVTPVLGQLREALAPSSLPLVVSFAGAVPLA